MLMLLLGGAAASALRLDADPNSVIPTGAGANATAEWRDLVSPKIPEN